MNYILVESSNIQSIAYDKNTSILEVKFKTNSSKVYSYKNVPEDVYTSFLNAPSKGKFFATNIKKKFEFSSYIV